MIDQAKLNKLSHAYEFLHDFKSARKVRLCGSGIYRVGYSIHSQPAEFIAKGLVFIVSPQLFEVHSFPIEHSLNDIAAPDEVLRRESSLEDVINKAIAQRLEAREALHKQDFDEDDLPFESDEFGGEIFAVDDFTAPSHRKKAPAPKQGQKEAEPSKPSATAEINSVSESEPASKETPAK